MHLSHNWCRNPSLGLMTKARGLQGCGPRGSLGVTPHVLESVRRCEGVNPHTPKATPTWEMESWWSPKFSKGNCRGQNSMAWSVPYIIGKLLKRRCLKWVHITHLHIWNMLWPKEGLGVKLAVWLPTIKSRESTRFPCVQMACNIPLESSQWGYNFASNLISIAGLLAKLWCPKVAKVPTLAISGLPLGNHGTKSHLDVGLVERCRIYYKGEGGGFPKSGLWWVLCVRVARDSS